MVTEAISAGIYHDLGSGSHVDYCVLEDNKTTMFRNAVKNENLHPISFWFFDLLICLVVLFCFYQFYSFINFDQIMIKRTNKNYYV